MLQPKEIILAYLGRKFMKHCHTLYADLWIVDVGLKPSFLLDYASVDVEKLNASILALYENGYLRNKLRIIQVDSFELFVYNEAGLSRHLEKVRRGLVTFLDVSLTNKTPRKMSEDKSKQLIQTLMLYLDSVQWNADNVIQIQPSNVLNRCTLFGVLLGYPVVYWFEIISSSSKNAPDCDTCLAHIPLKLHKVAICFSEDSHTSSHMDILTGRHHTVYSFSYPEDCDINQSNVLSWMNEVTNSVEHTQGILIRHDVNKIFMESVVL